MSEVATIDEIFVKVQGTKKISSPRLKGKEIVIRALTKGDFRRMKEFADKNPDQASIVDAWAFKTAFVAPDLSGFTPEEILAKMDDTYAMDIAFILGEILTFSGLTPQDIEELKNLAGLQKA